MLREKTSADLGLALTMLDSDRLRDWAEKFDTYGVDISHWADRRFVSEQLRAVAGRIEDTVREVGTLRKLAGIEPEDPDNQQSDATSWKAQNDAEARESIAELEAIARADLRDDFAKSAIAGLVVVNSALAVPFQLTAQEAYEVADAMLAAREKGGA